MSQRAPRNTSQTAYHPNVSFIQPPRGPPRPAPSPNKLYMTKISVGLVKVLYISDVHICHALVQTALPPGRGNEPQHTTCLSEDVQRDEVCYSDTRHCKRRLVSDVTRRRRLPAHLS